MKPLIAVLTILASGFSVLPARAACVSNGTDETLLFTIESRFGNERTEATLEPGGELCLDGVAGAVFRTFASSEDIEGCSRFAGPDGRDTLLAFHCFDNCRWASHGE